MPLCQRFCQCFDGEGNAVVLGFVFHPAQYWVLDIFVALLSAVVINVRRASVLDLRWQGAKCAK
jgi:hypothetical protein